MTSEIPSHTSQNVSQNDASSTKLFEERFARVMMATGATTDSGLAKALGMTQGSIGTAKKRLKIPSGWIEQVSVKFGISTDWLFFGTGPMHRGAAAASPAEPPALTPKVEQAPVAMRMEPARAGMLRAGDMLETPTPETYAAQVGEIAALRQENRELRQENRELRQENRELMKENADLRVAVAEMRARAAPERDASKEMPGEEARKSA